MKKEPTPTLGHCKNREKCVCFSFIFQTASPETLLSVLFMLHIASLSIIDRKTRKLKLRMRENRKGHRFLHFFNNDPRCDSLRQRSTNYHASFDSFASFVRPFMNASLKEHKLYRGNISVHIAPNIWGQGLVSITINNIASSRRFYWIPTTHDSRGTCDRFRQKYFVIILATYSTKTKRGIRIQLCSYCVVLRLCFRKYAKDRFLMIWLNLGLIFSASGTLIAHGFF